MFFRGAGCIFVEMITGIALFPGMRDTIDQLNKIWKVFKQVLKSPRYTVGQNIYLNPHFYSYLCVLFVL